jgi:NADPH-dependent 2,4-dienoyl-CoA reductase/sulfur reductase-like enzyme
VETCEALELAGIEVTVVEMLPQILSFLDWEMAKLVENHVKTRNARVITGNAVAELIGSDGTLAAVKLQDGTEIATELAVIAVGVRPNTELAKAAGLAVGERGGIAVNEFMQTSAPDVYAVGDCVEVTQRITGKKVLMPLGDLANLQGRVAGQNAALGNHATFPGTLQTGVCKVFDYAAGSTGLSERAARAAGREVAAAVAVALDKPPFMGGKPVIMKMVAETGTGRVLGFQCVGPGDASKRIAMAAVATALIAKAVSQIVF